MIHMEGYPYEWRRPQMAIAQDDVVLVKACSMTVGQTPLTQNKIATIKSPLSMEHHSLMALCKPPWIWVRENTVEMLGINMAESLTVVAQMRALRPSCLAQKPH